ncbi:RimJ/RimL family protein N-acetyltransferase [Enterococcus rivorum]|nr:RimJ/RimL family protein N-acetyltransferase [Enterococcus rivorum]
MGYVLTLFDKEDEMYCIWHMMIDAENQGLGYGKAALKLVIDYFQTFPFGKTESIGLTCHEENQAGLRLYRKLGFKETGEKDEDNERVMIRSLAK